MYMYMYIRISLSLSIYIYIHTCYTNVIALTYNHIIIITSGCLLGTVGPVAACLFSFDSEKSFWSGWNALRSALEAGGPLIAGRLSLQRLGMDLPVTRCAYPTRSPRWTPLSKNNKIAVTPLVLTPFVLSELALRSPRWTAQPRPRWRGCRSARGASWRRPLCYVYVCFCIV